MKEIILGTTHTAVDTVREGLLACQMGSGELPVYATPAMAALMENAAAALLKPFLDEGETSVGVALHLNHSAATPAGMAVRAIAQVTEVDRKKVHFTVQAFDETGEIGTATHDRFVVNAEKFLAKAQAKRI